MGNCTSKKQVRENKNLYTTPTQQNNKQELQSSEQQKQQQRQGQQVNNQQDNKGSNKYPHFYSDQNSKMNDIEQAKYMVNDEYLQEEYHRQNYPNYPQKPNSNIKQIDHLKSCNIQCPVHKQMNIQLVNIGTKVKERLMCYQCSHEKRKEEIKTISIDEFLRMSDSQYLDIFLVLENPLLKENYQNQFQKTKEIETSRLNIKALEDFKVKMTECIDQSIKLINESMDRLLKQQSVISKSFQNCNNLSTLQKYLSENDSNQDKLSSKISKLFDQQPIQNKQFEQKLQEYLQVTDKEINGQQIVIDNIILLNTFCNNNNIFSKGIPNQLKQFQNNFMNSDNLLKDASLIKTQQHYSQYPMDISLKDQKYISLKTNNNSAVQLNYINLEINQNKKYEMLLDFKSEDYNIGYVFLALSSKTNYDQQSWNENIQIPFLIQGDYSAYTMSEKGILIFQNKKDMSNIKIRIELKNKILRWKFDNNINSQKDWSQFKQDEPYFILFYSSSNSNSEIIIKHLKEVNEFEQW